jgi:hypothetical protein
MTVHAAGSENITCEPLVLLQLNVLDGVLLLDQTKYFFF